VLVTGPGQPGDKIDARRHVALFQILDELPPGRVPVGRGRRRAPRVPFFVARGITRRSASTLVDRLHAAGFDARIETRGPLMSREMRQKFSAMTARHAIGGGSFLYLLFQIPGVFHSRFGFVLLYSGLGVAWATVFASVAVRYSRPLLARGSEDPHGPDAVQTIAEALPRLRSRQDRRLVGRILERLARVEALGRRELSGGLVARAALLVEGLANLDVVRGAGASAPAEPERALAELRREEVTRIVLRADLLRVASRLDGLCLLLAGRRADDSDEETARLEREVQEIALQVESEQEVAALLQDRR